MRRYRQRGLTTVEFAIIGVLVVTLLFAIIEFSRIVFTLNMLQEGARRAARVAAVCSVGDAAIANAAVFINLPGLSTSNVAVEYLGQDGAVLANAAGANYSQIRYVRVRIHDYSMAIAIPFVAPTFDAPEYSSTLPRESLGVPNFGAAPTC